MDRFGCILEPIFRRTMTHPYHTTGYIYCIYMQIYIYIYYNIYIYIYNDIYTSLYIYIS